jgi:hypothetical protein
MTVDHSEEDHSWPQGANDATSSPAVADEWSYSGTVTAVLGGPPPLHPMVEERVKRAFELESHVTVFSEELQQIFFLRQLPEKAPRHRDRYVAALAFMAQYMKAVGFPTIVIGEFVELAQALEDLDRGTVRHFLNPADVTTRPRDPTDIWVARSFVAAAVQRLIESGGTRRAACKLIAQEYGVLAYALAPTSKREFHAVVEGWHRQLSERDRTSKQGRVPYHEQERFDAIIKETSFGAEELMHTALLLAVRATTPDALERFKQHFRPVKKAPLKSH